MCGCFWYKFFSKDDGNHLLKYLKKHYSILTYWDSFNYFVLTIDWNYNKDYVYILIPEYVPKALEQLQRPNLKLPQYSPHFSTMHVYGKIFQM